MEIQLGVIEARYADMIWEHEPVTSSELVKMTAVEFNWKRTTAHNVLRRLIGRRQEFLQAAYYLEQPVSRYFPARMPRRFTQAVPQLS